MSEHDREIWRPVPDWEGLYEVSNHGRVRSLDRIDARGRRWPGRIMQGSRDRTGWYTKVSLSFGQRIERPYVHRTVAEVFLGPCPPGMVVNHIDGDKTNNHIDNLEYLTHRANLEHASNTGLFPVGRQHHNTRLSVFQVQMAMLVKGAVTSCTVAKWFGVAPDTICAIWEGRTWVHLYREAANQAA